MSKKGEIDTWERDYHDEMSHNNIEKGYKSIYLEDTEEEIQDKKAYNEMIELEEAARIEENRLERIENKKRYIEENFLGDYPKELIDRKFIYNDNFKQSYDKGVSALFIDFNKGGNKNV